MKLSGAGYMWDIF